MSEGDNRQTEIEFRKEQGLAQIRRMGEAVDEWEGLSPQKRAALMEMLFDLIAAEVADYVRNHRPSEAFFKV
jgi:acyl-CoA reductase-like NAD-dependent aldehyde dehydrogenase